MLSLRSLSKRFGGVIAVDRVDLEVAAGEVHALIGPNGAGKTTLIHQISGSLPSDQGEVFFLEKKITHLKQHQRVAAGLARSAERNCSIASSWRPCRWRSAARNAT